MVTFSSWPATTKWPSGENLILKPAQACKFRDFIPFFMKRIREVTSKFMENFGSQLFKNIKYRDSFAMLGQRGIAKGKAIEIVRRTICHCVCLDAS